MKTTSEEINAAIAGYTDVVTLELHLDVLTGFYELRLELCDANNDSLILSCQDVSNLRIVEFGGGLTQFLGLRCDDVRSRQIDREAFHFADHERETVNFYCSSMYLKRSP